MPEEIERVVLELLAKLPEDRPASAAAVYERLLPYVVALPPLPGATAVAPNPDPMRMYATVVGRIADTALVGPRVPGPPVGEPAHPRPARVTDNDVLLVRQQAADMVEAGRFTQAIELMSAAVPQATAELGEDSPLVMALRLDLADAMFIDRDFEHARPALADLAAKLTEHMSPEHPVVLDCRLKEAGCLAGLGRTREALAQLQDLVPAFEQVYGTTGPETLGLRHEIGRLLVATGQADVAWPLLGDLLIDLRNVHGDDHPETEGVRELMARLDQLGR